MKAGSWKKRAPCGTQGDEGGTGGLEIRNPLSAWQRYFNCVSLVLSSSLSLSLSPFTLFDAAPSFPLARAFGARERTVCARPVFARSPKNNPRVRESVMKPGRTLNARRPVTRSDRVSWPAPSRDGLNRCRAWSAAVARAPDK